MFSSFNLWLVKMDDGSICVYIDQFGKVYLVAFASASVFRSFLKECLQYIDIIDPQPKLSQNIIDEINRL